MNRITPRDFRNAFVAVLQSEHDSYRTAVGFETKSYNFFIRTTASHQSTAWTTRIAPLFSRKSIPEFLPWILGWCALRQILG